MDKETLIHKVKKGIKAPFSDELIKWIRPAIRIFPAREETASSSLSQFGGIPLIKKGEQWIRSKENNKPYVFLLQLDLEELKSFDIDNRLPDKGILSVWYNLDYWDDGKVVYYRDKRELIKADLPKEYEEEEKRKKLPVWKRIFTKSNGFRLFSECQLKFEIDYQIPSWDSLQMKLFHVRNGTRFLDLEIDENFIDEYLTENKSDHHLLGYYVGLQESVYELMKITKGRYPNKLTEEQVKEGLEWMLLLQIDSDKITGMSWADWGKILFFIKEDDLQQQKFDNLNVQLDTT